MAKADPFKKLFEEFKKLKQSKGPMKSWTDAQLLKLRDKFRKIARKNRGEWTLKFYELLQEINKEGVKRGLPQKTD